MLRLPSRCRPFHGAILRMQEERLAGMAQEMAKVQQDNERLQAELAARDCEIERLKQAHASTVADTT